MIRRLFNDLKVEKDHLPWGILSLRYLVAVLVILLIFIFIGALLTRFATDYENVKDAFSLNNSILDTANGILAPLIAATAVATTFLAFLVQYQANQNQRNDINRERFERKFYEQLRLHKENTYEVNIFNGAYVGRSAFIKMFSEFKDCYRITLEIFQENEMSREYRHLNIIDVHEIAYQLFFFGVGKSSESFHSKDLQFTPLINDVISKIEELHKAYNSYYEYLVVRGKSIGNHPFEYQLGETRLKYIYRPFDGHVSRLGHYYRHLFHTVKFVARADEFDYQKPKKGGNEVVLAKREFLKVLRGQISNHEQALLYVNSLWKPGKKWWAYENKESGKFEYYFLHYHILKNVPLNLCDGLMQPQFKFDQELRKNFPDKKEVFYREKLKEAFEWIED